MFLCSEPVAVNVTSSLLASVRGLLEGDSLRPAEERMVNDLGLEGQIVYTEIKVAHWQHLNSSPYISLRMAWRR